VTTYAFDIDGTLTRKEIRKLANDLHEAGHTILIITGGVSKKPLSVDEYNKRIKEKEGHLAKLKIQYDSLHVCIATETYMVASMKSAICVMHAPIIIFEDTPKYIDHIEKHSNTLGLLVGKTKRKPYY